MGWHVNDLTAATGAPALGISTGYAFEARQTQHLFSLGQTDSHVHELWWDCHGWHYNDLTAATGAPESDTPPSLTAHVFAVQGTQHVYYRGYGERIHELRWDWNGWHYNGDLTAATGAPTAIGDLTGYAFNAENTKHVIYTGPDGHIHELWWDSNGWHHNDLTAAAGAPPLSSVYGTFPPSPGYVFNASLASRSSQFHRRPPLGSTCGTQHVVYLGWFAPDHHICELWWNDQGWHFNDLTAATGAPLGLDVAAYAFEAQGTQHVIYRGLADSHVHELWSDSDGWHHNDLTAATGAPVNKANVTGYVFPAQGTQHVVYRGPDFHIHELWWDSNGWHHNDLTAAAAAPITEGEPTGYVFNAQGTQHVIYSRQADSNGQNGGHVCELYWVP
jgi:hypothetical protein